MSLVFESRLSDSPYVEWVWQSRSVSAGTLLSITSSHWEMVVARHRGQSAFIMRGPETAPTTAEFPADGEWLGIRFKLGVYMRQLPVPSLIDRNDLVCPAVSDASFWFNGSAWEYPTFDNAETFVARLVRLGVIEHDETILPLVHGERASLSKRSLQRHFLRRTGMTHEFHCQIERARRATILLRQGASILDTAYEAGFYDQAHLTRSFKRLIGQTPANVACGLDQLSFLYNTAEIS